jgi:hypothetical protein
MMYEFGSSQIYWTNKHRRMADVYVINGILIIPVLLGVKGSLLWALGSWLVVTAAYFIVPLPIFSRFKAGFNDFGKRFWAAQSTGMLAVLLLALLPDWRGVIALGWGAAALILIIPIIRGMKPAQS